MSLSVSGNPRDVAQQVAIPTTTPSETLAAVAAQLAAWRVTAVGVASFGPVDLDASSATYGYITSTPKHGWRDTNVLGTLKAKLVRFYCNRLLKIY